MNAPLLLLLASGGTLLAAGPAEARELWAGGDGPRVDLRTSLKASALLSRAPQDPQLFSERDAATSLWRLRLEPQARPWSLVTVAAAYEQRLVVGEEAGGLAGLGVLPSGAPAAYRVRQLDWAITGSRGHSWRHEIDRGSLALHLPGAEVTVGRQAVGWGRGVLFGAVDLFAPFSPLEADREWRRGVDAVRADVKLADRVSLDAVAAFGERIDASAFAVRLRGYAGMVDAEIVAGWRARDLLAGVTSSAVVGGAEIHGELAVFRAPERVPAGGLGDGRWALKAVAGGSYRFALGNGLPIYAEYHYSGFGARRAEDVLPLLAEPDFRTRVVRGDTQILGRHALAVLANYDLSPELAVAAQWLQSPVDGSGLLAPSATVTFGDRLSVVATAYLPYGRPPQGLSLRSEYGSTSLSGFLQVRIYD